MKRENNKSEISSLDEPKSVQAQASAWLAKLDGDDINDADLQGFRVWVNKDTAHIAAFEKVAAAWDELNILTRLPLLLERQAQPAIVKNKPEPSFFSFRYAAIAATVVVGLLLGLQQGFNAPQHGVYTTAVGEQLSITLPDNSVVQLNTNSRLHYDYRGAARQVYLYQGEAHFSVAKNPDRLFDVYAGTGLVRAVGTAFAVMINDDNRDVNVIVTEGVVEIAPEITPEIAATAAVPLLSTSTSESLDKDIDKELSGSKHSVLAKPMRQHYPRVSAGSAVVFDQKNVRAIEAIATEKMQQRLAWQQGLLIFSGETLEEALKEVSRYTDIKIIIKSEQARDLRIGGQFKVGDAEAVLGTLEKGFGLKANYITNRLVYLSYDAPEQ